MRKRRKKEKEMSSEERKDREGQFVAYLLERMKKDKGFRAVLRRADNETTEYQSWEILSRWCDIEKSWERKPFALVAASLARNAPDKDGVALLGEALDRAYTDSSGTRGREHGAAQARLRRVLACRSSEEVLKILRSMLRLISSREVLINHAKLLNELLWFDRSGEKIKLRWAQQFYGKGEER
jgi:CRISPR system Cascade subunit CasB